MGIAGVTIICARQLGLSSGDLNDAFSNAGSYLRRFFPPDFTTLHYYSKFILETLAMAFWGTTVAFGLAALSTLMGARRFAIWPTGNIGMRGIMTFARVLPDLVLAIVFVSAFGPGPLAGLLTIIVGSFGALSKMWNEALERVDPRRIEGVVAAGGHGFQLLRFCGWPSISREVWGFTLFAFDRALREAAIIGIVGAGGIGMELSLSLRLFDYTRASVVILMIVGLILLGDMLSSGIRSRLN